MPTFALPIRSTYVAHWGIWECVREFIQNAVDEETQNGNEMTVKYLPRTRILEIENIGANMGKEALLIGETTKEGDSRTRGKFGEGLDLALLVGVRCDLKVMVETQTERWKPEFDTREEFGHKECLVIKYRKMKAKRNGVKVTLTLPEGMWTKLKPRFLFLDAPVPQMMVKTQHGTLLSEDKYRGKVFVKGIYVHSMEGVEFGYDFFDATLDRDRSVVQGWELEWRAAKILKESVSKSKQSIVAKVYKMLSDGKQETKDFADSLSTDETSEAVLTSLVGQFKLDQGDDAIPVENMAQSRELDHFGERGVVVSPSLYSTLSRSYGTFEDRMAKRQIEVTKTWAYSDLNAKQKKVLVKAGYLVDAAIREVYKDDSVQFLTLENLQIVDFHSDGIRGLCELASGKMQLARHRLEEGLSASVRTLIHEVAHATTGAGDGNKNHVSMIENLWESVLERLFEDAA